jgi:predicted acyltransferase
MFGYLVFNWYFWFTVGAACALAARAQARSEQAGVNTRRRRTPEAGLA